MLPLIRSPLDRSLPHSPTNTIISIQKHNTAMLGSENNRTECSKCAHHDSYETHAMNIHIDYRGLGLSGVLSV